MSIAWYAIRSKPNKEEFFWNQLMAHRIETFYPCLKGLTVNPRARRLKPYFPGYLFVHVDLDLVNSSFLHWMPGSAGLVSFDFIPASVPDSLISVIHNKVESINSLHCLPAHGMQPGDQVHILAGPFAGQDAIFDQCRTGSDRVRILIQFLRQRQIPVELPLSQVEKIK